MAQPNTKFTMREIAGWNWNWTTDSQGDLTNEAISAAALIDIAQSLRRIEGRLDSLGADGIHGLIRVLNREAMDRDYHRRKRKRATAKKRRLLRRVA